MKQKNKAVTLHEVRLLFENKFPELLAGAVDSRTRLLSGKR